MRIKSIEIKGLHNVTTTTIYNFENVNYITGSNGSGKTTILNGIQLALLGYIPGDSKVPSSVFHHANGPVLEVTARLDDGAREIIINRRWAKSGASVKTELHTTPEDLNIDEILGNIELPIFDFKEFLSLTANKSKDWFVSFLPSSSDSFNWQQTLIESIPKDMHIIDETLVDSAVSRANSLSKGNVIDNIRAVNADMKETLSYEKGELQRSTSTIQSLICYDEDGLNGDDAYLDEKLKAINQELAIISSNENTLRNYNYAMQNNARVQETLSKLTVTTEDYTKDPKYTELEAKAENLDTEIAQCNVFINNKNTELTNYNQKKFILQNKISENNNIIKGNGICPYTNESCESIKSLITKMQQESEDIEKAGIPTIQDMINKVTDEINEKQQKISEATYKLQEIRSKISSMMSMYNTYKQCRTQIMEVPSIEGLDDIEDYEVRKTKLNEDLVKIQANKRYNSLIDKLTQDKYRIENTIEVYKIWTKLTGENGLQTDLMEKPFKDFGKDMNKYLKMVFGEDITCQFVLSNKANSFSFGINRKSQYIPFDLLSSGEKALYTFALFATMIDKSNSSFKLIMLDDSVDLLDEENKKKFFDAMKSVSDNIQVILAGVASPVENINTIIR